MSLRNDLPLIGKMVAKTIVHAPQILYHAVVDGKLLYPGTKYIGPGNKDDEGRPTSRADRLAYQHDHQYGQLQKLGVDPYTHWNKADEWLVQHAKPEDDEQMALILGMRIKKKMNTKTDSTKIHAVKSWGRKYGPRRNSLKRRKKVAYNSMAKFKQ